MGDGESILGDDDNFYVDSTPWSEMENCKVLALSSEEGSTLVEGILTLQDSSRVYKVPISLQTRSDQSMCHWPSNGIYSLKSRRLSGHVNNVWDHRLAEIYAIKKALL
ncbi:hypothetical protein PVK06_041072 [Gossypium arboreum]|uniref:Uncharacterized protein n=1 Tax=Gossypium arboreum TaxID=29729 RepID=A0ABR0N771_GOSAR|nr:hypothetical protein PVK06_041072 [Gossypium arboreum]